MSSESGRKRRTFTDEEIEALVARDPHLPASTDAELAEAVAISGSGRTKVPISIRVDHAALEALKAQGPRYQTRVNDLLVAFAAGRVTGPLPEDVVDHFRPNVPGYADRIISALRDIVQREQSSGDAAMPNSRMRPRRAS
jgi:uncharacterized protein (DUF4415 family)